MCECSCDVESPAVYCETHPVARGPHECCECGGTIDPGERYERVRGLWDGMWITYVTCEFCAQVRDNAAYEARLRGGCGPVMGHLWTCVGMDYAARGKADAE